MFARLLVLAVAGWIACAPSLSWGRRPKMMSVQVRETHMRDKPSFLGKVVGKLAHGDRIQVHETRGAWMNVGKGDTPTGWVHKSALTKKKIKLQAGDQDVQVAASSDELALAGKGFNSDVEAEFKTKHKDIDFTWIDKMVKAVVSETEIQTFIKQGELQPAKGGAE